MVPRLTKTQDMNQDSRRIHDLEDRGESSDPDPLLVQIFSLRCFNCAYLPYCFFVSLKNAGTAVYVQEALEFLAIFCMFPQIYLQYLCRIISSNIFDTLFITDILCLGSTIVKYWFESQHLNQLTRLCQRNVYVFHTWTKE